MTNGATAFRATVGGTGLRLLLATCLVGLALLAAHAGALAVGSRAQATPAGQPPVEVTPLVIESDPIAALVPARPDALAIFAAGGAGLYRSDDGGQAWQLVGPPPPPGQVVAAADSPSLLLAGAHPPCARGFGEETPLQRSDDGGATWTAVAGIIDVLPLAIWSEAGLALGAGCAGLQLSTDAGATWQALPQSDAGYDVSAFAPVGADPASPVGLIASTAEGGTTVVRRLDLTDPANPVASDPLVRFWGGASLAGSGDVLVVGTSQGVLVSSDGGATWPSSRAGLEEVTLSVDPNQETIPEAERSRGYGITAVAIAPDDPARLYAGTIAGLFVSDDTSATWQPVAGAEGWVTGLVVAPAGDRLLAQIDAGVVVVPRPS